MKLLEHGSDRRETLPKRVSDNSRRFVFRRRKFFFGENFDRKTRFSLIWRGFGGSTAERTSKSASASNFAPGRLIQRSVHLKNLGFDPILRFSKNFHPDCRCPFSLRN